MKKTQKKKEDLQNEENLMSQKLKTTSKMKMTSITYHSMVSHTTVSCNFVYLYPVKGLYFPTSAIRYYMTAMVTSLREKVFSFSGDDFTVKDLSKNV